MAIIVECKNYTEPLKENQTIISSKYLDRKKLTRLGLMVTRRGLHQGGIKAQENQWIRDDKMIICLRDEDLIKMLELKENNDEPWKVIDNLIRQFLSSLS
jgi:hypothetical protein